MNINYENLTLTAMVYLKECGGTEENHEKSLGQNRCIRPGISKY
jgi:hypothetical protein